MVHPTPARLKKQPLQRFLLDSFTFEELRAFMVGLKPSLAAQLPGGTVSMASLVHDSVLLLERNDLLSEVLIEKLHEALPDRTAAIHDLIHKAMPAEEDSGWKVVIEGTTASLDNGLLEEAIAAMRALGGDVAVRIERVEKASA